MLLASLWLTDTLYRASRMAFAGIWPEKAMREQRRSAPGSTHGLGVSWGALDSATGICATGGVPARGWGVV